MDQQRYSSAEVRRTRLDVRRRSGSLDATGFQAHAAKLKTE